MNSFGCLLLKAQNANATGDSTVAMDASRTAKILNIVGLVCGVILIIICIAIKTTQHWRCLRFAACRCFGISAKPLLQWTSPPPHPGPLSRNRCLYVCVCVCVCVCLCDWVKHEVTDCVHRLHLPLCFLCNVQDCCYHALLVVVKPKNLWKVNVVSVERKKKKNEYTCFFFIQNSINTPTWFSLCSLFTKIEAKFKKENAPSHEKEQITKEKV